MKLWTSEKLTYSRENWRTKAGQRTMCVGGLWYWFAIPESASAVWVVVHDRPAKDRVKVVTICGMSMWFGKGERHRERTVWKWAENHASRLLKKNNGRPIYAEIWYEVEQ